MTKDQPSDLLGQLPRTRPHRRSANRPARKVEASGAAAEASGVAAKAPPQDRAKRSKPLAQPAQPRGVPARPRARRPAPAKPAAETSAGRPPSAPAPILGTAVQAAAELAEIGVALSARALRRAIERLPRP